MDRDHLEAVIRHELTCLVSAADSTGVTTGHLNAVTDHILTCADEYRLWRHAPAGAGPVSPAKDAREHRNELTLALCKTVMTPERIRAASAMLREGRPVAEVAKMIGVGRSTLYRWRESTSLMPAGEDAYWCRNELALALSQRRPRAA